MTYIAGALRTDAHGVPDDRLEILWLCATRVSQVYLMMQTDGGHAPMRVKGVERIVRPADILYLESSLHALHVHTAREVIETYGKLADALSLLPRRFVRTHQSFAVNLDAVRSLEQNAVTLISGASVPVSRRMRASVREALFDHIRTERR